MIILRNMYKVVIILPCRRGSTVFKLYSLYRFTVCLFYQPNMTAVAETCNTFRAYGDIWDNFQSIYSILSYYGNDAENFSHVAGPGHYNDADMVSIVTSQYT